MATIANRYSSFDSNSRYLAHLYWEDYELTVDMRQVPIELVFFLEDCIMNDVIFRQNPQCRCYNLFVDILWEVFREKTSVNKTNIIGLVNSIQSWYWSDCESDQDLAERWLGQEQLGQLLLNYPSLFDSDWVERNFFRK